MEQDALPGHALITGFRFVPSWAGRGLLKLYAVAWQMGGGGSDKGGFTAKNIGFLPVRFEFSQ